MLDARPGLGIVTELGLESTEVERERDQPLLGTVVEVPLEALSLRLLGFDHASARLRELLDPRAEVGLEACVLERDACGCGDRVEQLGLVSERRVVDESRDRGSLPFDERDRTHPVVWWERHRLAVEVGVAVEVGQPVREGERRIPERTRERLPEAARCRIGAEVEDELTDTGPQQARVEQPEQEDEWREPDGHERRPADRLELGLALDQTECGRDEEERDHHEHDRERVDEQRERSAKRPAGASPPDDEDDDRGEGDRAEHDELDVEEVLRSPRLRDELERIVGPEAAEDEADDLEPERRDVADPEQHAFRPRAQGPAGKREEHVHEHHRRDQVERDTHGEEDVRVRPREARQEDREARGDHQRPEAPRTPPPRDEPAEHVREHHPDHECRLDRRLVHVVAREREPHGARSSGAPGKADTQERGTARPTGHGRCRARAIGDGHCSTLTARAITRPRMRSEVKDSIAIASFAQRASGMTSVGLNASAFVKPR